MTAKTFDYAAMRATPDEQRDGHSYLTGMRVNGQHCPRCLRPDDTRPDIRWHGNGMAETIPKMTPCCGRLPCYGYVTTTAWEAKLEPSRTVWACCLGVADRRLGEPTWIPRLPFSEAASLSSQVEAEGAAVSTETEIVTPETRAARRLVNIASALQRHSGEEIARAFADLASVLANNDGDPAAGVARRDVALAVLGLDHREIDPRAVVSSDELFPVIARCVPLGLPDRIAREAAINVSVYLQYRSDSGEARP